MATDNVSQLPPATGSATAAGEPVTPSVAGQSWWARYRLPYLYILPAAIVLSIVTIYPIAYQIWMSLTDYSRRNLRGRTPDFVGLDNFVRILTNDLGLANFNFYRILGFNMVWTISNVFFHVTLGIAIALLLNRRRVFGRRLFR